MNPNMIEKLKKLFEDLQQECECGMLVDCDICDWQESNKTYSNCKLKQFSPRMIVECGLRIIEDSGNDGYV